MIYFRRSLKLFCETNTSTLVQFTNERKRTTTTTTIKSPFVTRTLSLQKFSYKVSPQSRRDRLFLGVQVFTCTWRTLSDIRSGLESVRGLGVFLVQEVIQTIVSSSFFYLRLYRCRNPSVIIHIRKKKILTVSIILILSLCEVRKSVFLPEKKPMKVTDEFIERFEVQDNSGLCLNRIQERRGEGDRIVPSRIYKVESQEVQGNVYRLLTPPSQKSPFSYTIISSRFLSCGNRHELPLSLPHQSPSRDQDDSYRGQRSVTPDFPPVSFSYLSSGSLVPTLGTERYSNGPVHPG